MQIYEIISNNEIFHETEYMCEFHTYIPYI